MTYELINGVRHYFEIEQGSMQWFEARCGIPTSSRFSDLVTPVKGDPSASMDGYADELAEEILQGFANTNSFASREMEMGKALEEEAADQYELIVGEKTRKVGLLTDEHRHYGASPDRLVGTVGLVEIKTFHTAGKHFNFLRQQKIDRKHYPQIQGQLLVAKDRDFVDWFAYNPNLPPVQIRTYRDDAYIAKLTKALNVFRDKMNERIEWCIGSGYMQDPTMVDQDTGELLDVTMAG